MPELPEVETTRRILEPLVVNRRVRGLLHQDPDRYPPAGLLVGRSFLSLGRRGKYLLAPMSGGLELVVHLGMSGGFRFAPGAHTRVRLDLDEGSLYFNDPRRFGRWWVVEKGQYVRIPLLLRMGPEPQSGAFTKKGFTAALAGSRRRIKDLLLSQQVWPGWAIFIPTRRFGWRVFTRPAPRTGWPKGRRPAYIRPCGRCCGRR